MRFDFEEGLRQTLIIALHNLDFAEQPGLPRGFYSQSLILPSQPTSK